MTAKDITAFLSEIELFIDLTDEQRSIVAEYMQLEKISDGQTIIEAGEDRNKLFVIKEGAVEEYKKNDLGKIRVIHYYKTKDFFGEGSLLDNYPHSLSARTCEDTTFITLHRKDFSKLFEEHTDILVRLISAASRVISRRVRNSAFKMASVAAHYTSGATRTEKDMIGSREVPADAYYGIQTLRATENFNISGISINHYPRLIKSLGMVKLASARANYEVGDLDQKISNAICEACDEIIKGKYHTQFVVDMLQGGAGTSTNMNANEVIANRALIIMGHKKGEYEYCHPNNHVNLAQSTNDVYPTALKITLLYYNNKLIKTLKKLIKAFNKKSKQFADQLKVGRTQLQDAVPMTLGQEFGAYGATLQEEIKRLQENSKLFYEINLGGTAIGTGLNAKLEYRKRAVEYLREISGYPLRLASNLVEATPDTGAFVMYSSTLKRLAIKLSKISNDLRLLSSGPRAGLHEINLPIMQPGSSIMPGKVNPVIPEVVNQVAFNVIGNDLTVTMAAEAGQLQLNVMEPVIARSLFESIQHLENSISTFRVRCVEGITANKERLQGMVQRSIGIVTALVPKLGYDVCSKLAKQAIAEDRTVYDLALEKELLSKDELDELLKPENMVK